MIDFGRDTSCADSLITGRTVTGARLVAEAAYRRLTTPRGMLRGGEEEANYGYDLTELVGSVQSDSDIASIPARIRAELTKDERIERVDVTVTRRTEGPALSLAITIRAITSAGPFELLLVASAVTVEIVGLEAAA